MRNPEIQALQMRYQQRTWHRVALKRQLWPTLHGCPRFTVCAATEINKSHNGITAHKTKGLNEQLVERTKQKQPLRGMGKLVAVDKKDSF